MAIDTACAESQESRILPLLNPKTRARHDLSKRSDVIPTFYAEMDGDELDRRIAAARAALGERLVILGHHYQRDEIIKYADYRGDSFKLAQLAAERPEADYIVFCGVHFMAESADVLSGPHQKVILPNPAAGCSMADMANITEVEECWETLTDVLGEDAGIIPVTYMNSAANLKAFCGRHGGIVCTSSNAPAVMKWAFEQGKRVLFFPDEHLGRNTGLKFGIPDDAMTIWNPKNPMAENDAEDRIERAKIILWKGYCTTHMRFNVQQIEKARVDYPDIKIIVHPECRREVVEAADLYGSTEYIIQQIEKAPAGTKWGVATEINLVHRLAQEHPDQFIFCLDPIVCPCSTMYRIHPAYLAWVLEGLLDGEVINQISVDPDTVHWARVALERMLALKG
ncbi:quinolinate synthase NadA [Ktedonobacter racemifer]|uniref:Quinolinate synthase n=1 Tax=Ktedonobacter racemifer DSM 44963 TaxID=485913 RepID=D6TIL3_KTERA|nr:quinolinate synthase NadA [Ktedonobacter racemifer]EFH89270.1 quinolinate synthetase complex, A subunit [Ktedonobacter racemifer DSM 44963]